MNYNFADRLIELRRQKGMSQEELARTLGISRQAVSKWERAESAPDIGNLVALAELYGVTLDDLVHGTAPTQEAAPETTGDASADADAGPAETDYQQANGAPDADTVAVVDTGADADVETPALQAGVPDAPASVPATETATPEQPPYYDAAPTPAPPAAAPQAMPIETATPPAAAPKKRRAWLIVLLVFLVLILGGSLFSCVSGCNAAARHAATQFAANFDAAEFENAGDATIDAGSIRNIEVQWAAGQVDVVVGTPDQTDILLTETALAGLSDRQRMRWRVQGDTLQVAYGWEASWLVGCSATGNKHLTIQLPPALAEGLGSLTLQAASGSYCLTDLTCESLNIDLASGEVAATETRAENLRMNVASGYVDMTGAFTDLVDLDIASGNVAVTSTEACPARANVTLLSGNIDFGVPADSSFTAAIDKLSGSFDCSFPDSVYDKGGNCKVGTGDATFDFDITSGNVIVRQA